MLSVRSTLFSLPFDAMGCDIFPDAEHEEEQEDMESEMRSEVGWINPRGFIGESWGRWYNVWDDMTGMHISDHYNRVETILVHKALVHALKWTADQATSVTECSQLVRWLEICCDYNASLFFHQ